MIAGIVIAALAATAGWQSDEATLSAHPAQVLIGQPLEWTLRVWHAAGDAPVVLADPLPDATWTLLDGPRRDTSLLNPGAETEVALTTMRWSVMSLTPGERELPALEVRLEGGGTIVAVPERLVVAGELAADEDAPRAMTDFHAIEERTSGMRWTRLGLIGAGVLVVLGGAVLFARKREAPLVPPPTARQRLRDLAASTGGVDREGGARGLAFELAAILRGSVDERLDRGSLPRQQSLSGRTDEEWCEVVRSTLCGEGRLAGETLDTIEELLAWCGEVRFGAAPATRFRVDEQLERAAGVLDELGRAALEGTGSGAGTGTEGAA